MKIQVNLIVLLLSILALSLETEAQFYEIARDQMSSENADFGAAYYEDGIVFCSNRNQKLHMNDDDSLQQFRTDLFFYNPGQLVGEERLFSKEVTTWLNEGPLTFNQDETILYFTGNVEPENLKRKDKVKVYKLGIFEAKKVNGTWMKTGGLPFNSEKYNVAHPALSNDDSYMVFASNKGGGIGAADLYITRQVEGVWSEPELIPAPINSEANEMFPFIDERGRLFYSSNRDGGDMDVYCAVPDGKGGFRTPFMLGAPINSDADDFGFICRNRQSEGYFSSNRLDSIDNLYNYSPGNPNFVNCKPVNKASYCYMIEEEKIMEVDSLPLKYVWDFGDGEKAEGLKVKHCFADTGLYQVKLNIIDTISNLIYAEVSSLEIDIEMPEQAYFSAPDTLHKSDLVELSANDQYLENFDLDEWLWDFGDGNMTRGEKVELGYLEEGTYRLTLGGITFPDAAGRRMESCVYKDVVVVGDNIQLAEQKDDRYKIKEADMSTAQNDLPGDDVKATYFVELARSEKRIPYNAKVFEGVSHTITERFLDDEKLFAYSVGEGSTLKEVYTIFNNLADSGYTDMQVKGDKITNYFEDTTKKGDFIASNDTTALNNEFKKLRDIKFEYDSHEILEESFANLDYIISMLEVEDSYRVSIGAHTDNIGGYKYNMKLADKRAESVVKYFEEHGILKDRMVWEGFGDTKPIATNDTEEGRAMNRRVEFEIIEMNLNVAEE